MLLLRRSIAVVGFAALVAAPAMALGQSGFSQMAPGGAPQFHKPGSYSRISGQNNPAINYFGGNHTVVNGQNTRAQQIPAPETVHTGATSKPHSGLQRTSGVTPYLALDQLETQEGLPNYYLYVKPQLDQSQMNQTQQVQYRRMQQQMRRATTTGVIPASTSGGMPTTGHSSQFFNNGGYYPGLRK